MGLFRRGGSEERVANLAELLKIIDRAGLTVSGVTVDPDKAMRLSAWWAAVELVASVGSSLPLDEFRTMNGEQVTVPLSGLFADPDPDPSITAQAWRSQILRSVAARGNAYAMLDSADGGTPRWATTIHPDRVDWQRNIQTGEWSTRVDGKPVARWPLGPLWHFGLFQQPGSPVGLSPVEYHRQTIGQALAAQDFGQRFFGASGVPSIVVKIPGATQPSEAELTLVKNRVSNLKPGEPIAVAAGTELDKITITAEDSQFLETQRMGVEEIARVVLGGFPELIGGTVTGGGSITYANREQRMADFIALSLAPRFLVPFEAALSTLIPRGRFVKHNVNALLRSDLAARYASYKVAAETSEIMGRPLMTTDEMRRLENLPPLTADDIATFERRPAPSLTIGGPNA